MCVCVGDNQFVVQNESTHESAMYPVVGNKT